MRIIFRSIAFVETPCESVSIKIPRHRKGDTIVHVAHNEKGGEPRARWYRSVRCSTIARVSSGKDRKVLIHGRKGEWVIHTLIYR